MKRTSMVVMLMVVVLALTGCGTVIPNMQGRTVAQARTSLSATGFVVGEVTYDETGAAGPGLVVSQQPAAGSRGKRGSAVNLKVAGSPPVPAPSLLNLDRTSAATALSAVGLVQGAVTQSYDASAPAGAVVSQTPAPQAKTPKGSSVAFVISKGPQPVLVPSVKGKTEASAKTSLKAAGFVVKVVKKASSEAKGVVITQKPAGDQAQPGSTVVITVSTGVEMVTVPDLYKIMAEVPGLDIFTPLPTIETFINKRLASKGLEVRVVMGTDTPGGAEQHPPSGSRVPRGTLITLEVLD